MPCKEGLRILIKGLGGTPPELEPVVLATQQVTTTRELTRDGCVTLVRPRVLISHLQAIASATIACCRATSLMHWILVVCIA